MTIRVAHDFTCGWCWIGIHQAEHLKDAFGVEFDWIGHELYPDPMPFPVSAPKPTAKTDRPKTPSRFALARAAQRLEPIRQDIDLDIRTRNAHLAIEHIKKHGDPIEAVRKVYDALWKRAENIEDISHLVRLLGGFVPDACELEKSIREGRGSENIVPFDEPSHAVGVYNVPTFFIGGERYAEQPQTVLEQALTQVLR